MPRLPSILAASFVACLAGCSAERHADGDAVVFAHPAWTWLASLAGGIAFAALAVWLRRRSRGMCLTASVIGLLLIFVEAPALFGERVVVSAEGYSSGGSASAARPAVRFAEVVRLEARFRRSDELGHRDEMTCDLHALLKSGRTHITPLGRAGGAGALAEIARRAAEAGVPHGLGFAARDFADAADDD